MMKRKKDGQQETKIAEVEAPKDFQQRDQSDVQWTESRCDNLN